MNRVTRHHIYIGLTTLVLGFLIVLQWRSFSSATSEHRDVQKNVFREIQLLYSTNKDLKDQVKELNQTLEEVSSQASALKSIEQEIVKDKIIAGDIDVFGPGISLQIYQGIDVIWLTDMVNELFNGGAEAISVNGLRLTDTTQGFEITPQGQIYLHGNFLQMPYVIQAIGEPKELEKVLTQATGILPRMKDKYPNLTYSLSTQERIEMKGLM